MGTLRLASSLDDNKMRVIARNDINGITTLGVSGDYFLDRHTIDATADFNGMDVGYIAPVLESVFSEMGGAMSGRVHARGPLGSLSCPVREPLSTMCC